MLNSIITDPITLASLLICLFTALILGILASFIFSYKSKNSSSLSFTLALLPLAMCMIVMLINGNLGIAISVAGGFTLVRFRSIAGTGREISAIFVVMTLGVITGMGYIGIAVIFFAIVALITMVFTLLHFGEKENEKLIRVTIPEDYDYENLLEEVFQKYGAHSEIVRIKTTNMGSLIEVTYKVSLKENTVSKKMLDDIRSKNSNLSIVVSSYVSEADQL